MKKQLQHYLCGKFISEGNWSHMRRSGMPYEIIVMLEGEMHIAENDDRYLVKANDMLLLRAGRTHFGYEKSEGPVSFYWVHFHMETEPFMSLPSHASLKIPSSVNQLFKQLLHVSSFTGEEADAALLLLLSELTRQAGGAYRPHSATVDQICRWIDIHLNQDINVRRVAEEFNFNKEYISKMVKREKGVGLKTYILNGRMDRARQLLLTTHKSVKEIAVECGFADYKLFLRRFRQYEGVTPSQYRNRLYSTPLNN
ncbi:helix-turn-helix transcriptional regulator [Paenibacillus sp. CAU 1782]